MDIWLGCCVTTNVIPSFLNNPSRWVSSILEMWKQSHIGRSDSEVCAHFASVGFSVTCSWVLCLYLCLSIILSAPSSGLTLFEDSRSHSLSLPVWLPQFGQMGTFVDVVTSPLRPGC